MFGDLQLRFSGRRYGSVVGREVTVAFVFYIFMRRCSSASRESFRQKESAPDPETRGRRLSGGLGGLENNVRNDQAIAQPRWGSRSLLCGSWADSGIGPDSTRGGFRR